jgi:membrane protein implicated in regulation of membrane protease activity
VYGTWFLTILSVVAVILLIVGLIAYAPIIAVAIALVIAVGILWGLARRRTQQMGAEHATAARERRAAGQEGRPTASGAPASGEGGAAEAQRAARLRGR